MSKRSAVEIICIAGVSAAMASPLVLQSPASAGAEEAPETLRLLTTVRDFKHDHADFDVGSVSALGHCAGNVTATLPDDRRPGYTAAGQRVAVQWYDRDGHPIMPYLPPADDGGLPGGHFDVDVFDGPSDDELYHKHEFDDAYDVNYVDIAQDSKLLFDEIIGAAYPNDLRVEFYNAHHGVGTYEFEAGAVSESGPAQDGFTAVFDPGSLETLRVTFSSLNDMRHTSPGPVQNDVAERDGAFAVRMYDVMTDALVYELAVYHHGHAAEIEHFEGDVYESADTCGDAIEDDIGTLANACPGAVTGSDSFDQWFRDVLGTNLSSAHMIELHRNLDGVYEHLSHEFYPVDDRLFGNQGHAHNNFFTVSFTASFTFEACADWFFEFQGQDDAWVFIDDRLVIDLGGAAPGERQRIDLDRLGLEAGETYNLSFFYAHRRDDVESLFNLRTNIPLVSNAPAVTSSYD